MTDKELQRLPRESQVTIYTDMYTGLLGAEERNDDVQMRKYSSTLSYLKEVLALSYADIAVIEARTVRIRTQIMLEIADILDDICPSTTLN